MTAGAHLLKATEAAVVAGADIGIVNQLLSKHVLPDEPFVRNGGRHVLIGGCVAINFYIHSAGVLDAHARRSAIARMLNKLRKLDTYRMDMKRFRRADWTVRETFVTIEFWDVLKDTFARFERLESARAIVVVDDKILAGAPILKGTRIPVYIVAAMVSAGVSKAEIVKDYPGLDEEQMELAAIYANANPLIGRPISHPKLPVSVSLIERKFARAETPTDAY
ncbi:DUF433 domain-containing protein [Ensifer sp. SL37]|uniref:DUF433 domain-containing protein n=1 Tax=Ensifer sp. SL37 TaxID=2995137 RepID=UPI002272977D|nr:DUF433 domain-containing protein [Ensifer sp. SL37]MCY1740712.1 DUF433 domain-containing protein [Ensifer sp. SL37]